jgi:hypothetical protein
MRLSRLLLALTVLSATLTPTFAQTAAAAPPLCTGSLNIVRVSDIKPGMMDKFLQAVAAQQAWYKAAGTSDVIQVMRIMERNPDTRVSTFSETQALTTHIEPASRTKGPDHDAGYDAFVAMFKDSSTIKTEYVTCIVQ